MERLLTVQQLTHDRLTNALRQFPASPSFSISVICPVTKKRLKHPAISLNCIHSERVELKAWIASVLEQKKWVCPFCQCKAELPDIYVDYPMQQKLEESQGDQLAQNIEVDDKGEYVITRRLTKQRSSVLASVLGDSSNRRGVTVMLKGVDNPFHDFLLTSSEEVCGFDTGDSVGFFPPTVYLMELGMPFVQRFNIANNKWRMMPSFPNPGNTTVNMSTVYSDVGAFFLGGQDSSRKALSTVFLLREAVGVRQLASLTMARFSFPTLCVSNKLFAVGGQNETGMLSACERMDLTTGKWVEAMDLPKPRANAGACLVNSDFIFLFGGTTPKDFYSRDIERLHIASSVWESLYVRMPVGVADPLVFNAPDLDLIFIMGGFGESGKLRQVITFNFKTGIWNLDLPRLKVPCVEHSFFPVMFDYEHRVMHFFDGRGGSASPIKHLYYSIDHMYQMVKEGEEEDGSSVDSVDSPE